MTPVETLHQLDRELSEEHREEAIGRALDIQTKVTEKGVAVTFEWVETCRRFDVARVSRTTTVERSYSAHDQEEIKGLKFWGIVGAVGGAVVSGGALALYEPNDMRDSYAALGGAASAAGIWMLANAVVLDRNARDVEMPVETFDVVREDHEARCSSKAIQASALEVSGLVVGATNDDGMWRFEPEDMSDIELQTIMSGSELSVTDEGLVAYGDEIRGVAHAECVERAAPAREAVQKTYDWQFRRYQNSALVCVDGSYSPSCRCGGSHRGCCSHHGGVSGCSRSQPVVADVPLCGE